MSNVTDQWLRKWGLIVYNSTGSGTAIVITQGSDAPGAESLRMVFHVKQTDGITPNYAIIRIYNLAEKTVNAIVHEYTRVTLQAGYLTGRYATIFDGWIKMWKYGRETVVDTYLELYVADGDIGINTATISKTLTGSANTRQGQITASAEAMGGVGVGAGNSGTAAGGGPVQARPTVMWGLAQDEMTVAAQSSAIGGRAGLVWSVQNGQLVLVPANGVVAGETALINYQSGMVGFPAVGSDGIEVRTLLNPSLHVRQKIVLNNGSLNTQGFTDAGSGGTGPNFGQFPAVNSELQFVAPLSADGTYTALVIEHSGDTRGNEWYTDVICWAIDSKTGIAANPDGTFPSLAQISNEVNSSPPANQPNVAPGALGGSEF